MKKARKLLSVVIAAALLLSLLPLRWMSSAVSSGDWHWPCAYSYVLCGWGEEGNQGIDFAAEAGSDVIAACDGEVVRAEYQQVYGNFVKIKAKVGGADVYILYAHLLAFDVSVGDKVKSGQRIGSVGKSGRTDDYRLHYEINTGYTLVGSISQTLNPWNYLPGTSYTFEIAGSAPSFAFIRTDKTDYNVGENVVFSFSTNGDADRNTLRIVKPDGSEESFPEVGAAFTMSFALPGEYAATVEAQNDFGICRSDRVSFSVGRCIVTFDPCGGTCTTESKIVTFGAPYGMLPTPSRTGYAFDGWYTSLGWSASTPDGALIASDSIVEIESTQTLYAHWTARPLIVSFNPNGGTCDVLSKTVQYDGIYGILPVPTRTGYVFEGWYTSADGSLIGRSQITSESTVKTVGVQTLYAQWVPQQLNISFNPCGGTCTVSHKAVPYNGYYGSLPTPKRPGYTFDGWFTSAAGGTQITAKNTVTVTENHMLYAHWAEEPVTLMLVTVETLPDITDYMVGDTLDTTGLTLCALYSDGMIETIESGFVCTSAQLSDPGTQTITVTFKGLETSFDVVVHAQQEPDEPGTEPEPGKLMRLGLTRKTARPGDRVEMQLCITRNPGIIAASVSLTYDPEKLRLVEVRDSGLMGDGAFTPGNDLAAIPYTVLWVNSLAEENITENGLLATFVFEVLQDAEPGNVPVTLQYEPRSTFDVDLNEVECRTTAGMVLVRNRVAGDANGDKSVDLKDAVILTRYLVGGWNVTINTLAADVNGDGNVDLKDVTILRRYLAGGWNIELK